jgi:hypothetical protein
VQTDYTYWEQHWKSQLQDEPSAAWPWDREIREGATVDGRLCLAISRADRVEALLSLRVARGESLRPAGLDMVYVEYVSTAPENFPEPDGPRLIAGLGTVMIATAVQMSLDCGFEGRLGLHSKPKAEPWYRNWWRFTDCGLQHTADGPMIYFEAEPGKFRWPLEGASI